MDATTTAEGRAAGTTSGALRLLFLVRMGDELAYEPGTTEHRFRERVRRMAVLAETLLHKRVHDANASSEAASNTPRLLRVLRESIRRQRAAAAGVSEEDET